MTYTKKLASIVITTMDGAVFNVTDTVECPVASSALSALKNNRGASVEVGDDLYYIPSSAVANIKISYTDSEPIEKPDTCEE